MFNLTNPDGTVSSHSSQTSAASADTLGYSQDAHHITVTGANITHSFAVSGEDVAVSGKGGQLVFTGQTHGLSVTGNDNHIDVDNATLIEVTGDRNHVRFSGARPTIKISGGLSSVDPK